VSAPRATSLPATLLRYAGRRWPAAAAVLALALLRVALDLLKPWPLKVLVDHALGAERAPAWLAGALSRLPGRAQEPGQLVGWCVAATVLVFLAGWAVTAAAAAANLSFGQRLAYDVGADLFAHLQRLSLRFHGRASVGDSLRRVTSDSASLGTMVQGALVPAVTSAATLAAMVGVLWRMDLALMAVALASVPPMVLAFRLYARPMMELSYRQQQIGGRMYGVVEQALTAMPVVQSFGRERHEEERLHRCAGEALEAAVDVTGVQLRFKVLVGLATAAGTAGILYLGGLEVLAGQRTVGEILVFLAYLAAFYAPLESMAYTSSTLQGAAGSARRVVEVLRSEPDVEERPAAAALPRSRGEVRLEDVSFGYDPGRPVLHGVTLSARPGETLALVGPTGAGKSTVAALVPRLLDPWRGRVLLDGNDVRDLRVADVRRNVAVVPQDAFLFPTSILENVRYGRPGASRGDVERAARAANAEEFIAALPEGYDTLVGERGATLSGGQRQRLTIARALVMDPPVLVLDEPTSALDAATEHLLWEALQRLMRGRTTIVIAHRLSTVRAADRIAVLDGGRVVQVGTHDELVARAGLYRELCETQLAAARPPAIDPGGRTSRRTPERGTLP
jgi:ATP-binding cassette, subfamily B, bacterial